MMKRDGDDAGVLAALIIVAAAARIHPP